MGDSWFLLAEPVRDAHTTYSITRGHGHLRIEHARHRLVRVLARILRLPRSSDAADTQLVVIARADGEEWVRTFAGRSFVTRQYQSSDFELAERFGRLEFRFRLDACGGSLVYVQREVALVVGRVRLRIPDQWAPHVDARVDPVGPTRVDVGVRVSLPGVGLLIAYAGGIEIEETCG